MSRGALRGAGRHAEAEALLAKSINKFPNELEPIWVYALLSQERGEQAEAARRFKMLLDRFPSHRDSHLRMIGLLRDLGRFAEAEDHLGMAMQRFAADPWFVSQYGWTALSRNDPAAALERFHACRARFPDYADAVVGAAAALRGSGEMQQADDLLADGVARFPGDSGIAFGYADHGLWMRTAGLLAWEQALLRWDRLRATFPDFHRGYVEGIRVLADAGRTDAAEALASEATKRFPSDIRLAAEFARRAEDRKDWPELIRRFQRMVETFPDHASGHAGLGRALSLAGRQRRSITAGLAAAS